MNESQQALLLEICGVSDSYPVMGCLLHALVHFPGTHEQTGGWAKLLAREQVQRSARVTVPKHLLSVNLSCPSHQEMVLTVFNPLFSKVFKTCGNKFSLKTLRPTPAPP
jgi:hypothetical protein